VASEAELIDLELLRPMDVDVLIKRLNVQLPEGFTIVEGRKIPWKSTSPSAALVSSHYRIPLPEPVPGDLDERIEDWLAAEQIAYEKQHKGRPKQVDLRPDIVALSRADGELEMELKKGSPLQVAALLLGVDVEQIRKLGVVKTAVRLKE